MCLLSARWILLHGGLFLTELDETLPLRDRVHRPGLAQFARGLRKSNAHGIRRLMADGARIVASACTFGPVPVVKSIAALAAGWSCASAVPDRYAHVLAYWGNYVGTCACLFHRIATGQRTDGSEVA